MTRIEKINAMPKERREKLLWIIVGSVLVLMVLIWVLTSLLPKRDRKPADIFRSLNERILQAKKDFPQETPESPPSETQTGETAK